MHTSQECYEAWSEGYMEGWRENVKSVETSIPHIEGGVPPGVIDELAYYREKGRARGQIDGLRYNAGLVKSSAYKLP